MAEVGENGELRCLSRQLVKALQRLKYSVADIKSEGTARSAEDRPG
jgi:hypothetical protein